MENRSFWCDSLMICHPTVSVPFVALAVDRVRRRGLLTLYLLRLLRCHRRLLRPQVAFVTLRQWRGGGAVLVVIALSLMLVLFEMLGVNQIEKVSV